MFKYSAELPAVLLNAKSGLIESEFSHYVKPTQFPKLSAFCTELTGITQSDVDKAVPLKETLQLFDEWLQKFANEKDLVLFDDGDRKQNVAVVTWTDFDIGVYLKGDCKKKSIDLPKYFQRRIDTRDHYKVGSLRCLDRVEDYNNEMVFLQKWTRNYRNLKFTHALQNAGIHAQGRAHSGIDDSRNLSRLVNKMVQKGYKLTFTDID